jgi:hypothetical protein
MTFQRLGSVSVLLCWVQSIELVPISPTYIKIMDTVQEVCYSNFFTLPLSWLNFLCYSAWTSGGASYWQQPIYHGCQGATRTQPEGPPQHHFKSFWWGFHLTCVVPQTELGSSHPCCSVSCTQWNAAVCVIKTICTLLCTKKWWSELMNFTTSLDACRFIIRQNVHNVKYFTWFIL